MMVGLYKMGRRWAGAAKRGLFPKPELAAWRKACREAERVDRYTPGRIRLLDYDLEYVDLLTLCPQWNDVFVRETLRFSLPTPSPRILDCGANVGLVSLFFKRLYPLARITAYEADPAIAELLRRNLTRNQSGDVDVEVEVVNAAVWTSDEGVTFHAEGADSGTVKLFASGLRGAEKRVPSIRLRSLLERERIDVLKLDIEGGELDVLDDCRDILRTVPVLLLDLHEFDANRRTTAKILELLERAGLTWSVDELCPLPWREPIAGDDSPFPGTHLCWAVLVRAWRDESASRREPE